MTGLTLRATLRLSALLTHLYVLLPVLDDEKRFVRREPLYRVHECVFAVLALDFTEEQMRERPGEVLRAVSAWVSSRAPQRAA